MKELFREREFTTIGYYRNILETAGIKTFVRNENLHNNEVPIPDFFPALCVVNDEEYDRALQVIQEHVERDREASDTEVECASCGEKNPGNFEVCWSCGGAIHPNG